MSIQPVPKFSTRLFLAAFFLLGVGCAVPTTSLTTVSVSGILRGADGAPVSERPVEVVLPASYGLNEIDLSHGEPQSYGHQDQRAIVRTDALGSFSHTFAPVEYSEKFWILPPLGTLLGSKPTPQFFVRLPDTGDAYYSVMMDEKDTVYGVYVNAPARMGSRDTAAVIAPKPADLKGRLLPDSRDGADGWIANLEFQYLRPTFNAGGKNYNGQVHRGRMARPN